MTLVDILLASYDASDHVPSDVDGHVLVDAH